MAPPKDIRGLLGPFLLLLLLLPQGPSLTIPKECEYVGGGRGENPPLPWNGASQLTLGP